MAINPLAEPLKVFLLDLLANDPEVQAAVVEVVLAAQAGALARRLGTDTELLTVLGATIAKTQAPAEPPAKRGPGWLADHPMHPDNTMKGSRP